MVVCHLSLVFLIPFLAPHGKGDRSRSRLASWCPVHCLPTAVPRADPRCWVPCLHPSPVQPLATQVCGLGPECRPPQPPLPLDWRFLLGWNAPPPHGASARPGLLAASPRLPEHAPPIYRQGPPPTAISVSCQLPAAHSGRRSREPGPELSPVALGGNTESLPAH